MPPTATDSSPNSIFLDDEDGINTDTSTKKKRGTGKSDARKQSLYFKEEMLLALKEQAKRLDRSLSWVVSKCVGIGMPTIQDMPSADGVEGSEDE